MNLLQAFYFRTVAFFYALYIRIVYWSSRVEMNGRQILSENEGREKFLFIFWHGESYCLYPLLEGRKAYAVVTSDTRGNYIAPLCSYFGYSSIRLPDRREKGNSFHVLRKVMGNADGDLLLSLDGPTGPYHCPKDFPFALAMYLRYRVIPISMDMKRKVSLRRRWDRFTIPLPFNRIVFTFHDPLTVSKSDLEEDFSFLKEKVRSEMEHNREALNP
ncbi:MAG TPA: hypothetical protein PLV56_08875 [Synergistales bacterium]|nr:hypothetical protein [Synergistales bacterium]